jgi:hypothetical protein
MVRDFQKNFFARAHFFLEEHNPDRYGVARKGVGEDEERVVNNLLIAWMLSHAASWPYASSRT